MNITHEAQNEDRFFPLIGEKFIPLKTKVFLQTVRGSLASDRSLRTGQDSSSMQSNNKHLMASSLGPEVACHVTR